MDISGVTRTTSVEQGSSVKSQQTEAAPVEQAVSTEAKTEASESEGVASHEQIKKAVDEINKRANGSEAIFGIHEETNRVTIKIVDKDTKDVIKEFPAEKTLDMIAKVWEMAGMMVDEKR